VDCASQSQVFEKRFPRWRAFSFSPESSSSFSVELEKTKQIFDFIKEGQFKKVINDFQVDLTFSSEEKMIAEFDWVRNLLQNETQIENQLTVSKLRSTEGGVERDSVISVNVHSQFPAEGSVDNQVTFSFYSGYVKYQSINSLKHDKILNLLDSVEP